MLALLFFFSSARRPTKKIIAKRWTACFSTHSPFPRRLQDRVSLWTAQMQTQSCCGRLRRAGLPDCQRMQSSESSRESRLEKYIMLFSKLSNIYFLYQLLETKNEDLGGNIKQIRVLERSVEFHWICPPLCRFSEFNKGGPNPMQRLSYRQNRESCHLTALVPPPPPARTVRLR